MTAAGLASHELVTFVPSADLERARDFYAARLGLPVRELNDFACVLDGNGTMVRVTAVPGHSPAAHTILGWMVEDITAEVRALAGRGDWGWWHRRRSCSGRPGRAGSAGRSRPAGDRGC